MCTMISGQHSVLPGTLLTKMGTTRVFSHSKAIMAEKKAKAKLFQNTWLEKYALRITARCSKTTEVVSVVCQFCETYGTEDDDNPDRKRKRTLNVCFFKKPWRSNHIERHCETFHRSKFAEYGDLTTDAERIQFFKPGVKQAHIKMFGTPSPTKADSIICTIGLPVIDVIVAQLVLEPLTEEEESDINFEVKALSIFHLNDTDSDHQRMQIWGLYIFFCK